MVSTKSENFTIVIVCTGGIQPQHVAMVRAAAPTARVATADTLEEVPLLLRDASVVLSWRFPEGWLHRAPKLRWLHVLSSGVEHVLYPAMRRRGVVVTNSRGAAGPAVAEYAVLLLLMLVRKMPVVAWQSNYRGTERPWADELYGRTILVVGLGEIGQRVAAMARSFGMRVLGCRLSGAPLPGIQRVVTPAGLMSLLPEADVIVLAAPLNEQSEGLIGHAALQHIKHGALLVNVARGGLIDEDPVREALADGRLGGAALDVVRDEPLSDDSPWWSTPNVLLSPHLGSRTPHVLNRAVQIFCENLRHWQHGEGLINVVSAKRDVAPDHSARLAPLQEDIS